VSQYRILNFSGGGPSYPPLQGVGRGMEGRAGRRGEGRERIGMGSEGWRGVAPPQYRFLATPLLHRDERCTIVV